MTSSGSTTASNWARRSSSADPHGPGGALTFFRRTDGVSKASDASISPFELESVPIEYEAVAAAAVVPSPDPSDSRLPGRSSRSRRGHEPDEATARAIPAFARDRVALCTRIRRIEFADLPKTINGRARRVELRAAEQARTDGGRNVGERWEEDFR